MKKHKVKSVIHSPQNKIWGQTTNIFQTATAEVYRIVGTKGGYCSVHHHAHKFNKFFIERGQMTVRVWDQHGKVQEHILNTYDSLIIPPGVKHQFCVTHDDTVAYEIYWVELHPEDITRESEGGLHDAESAFNAMPAWKQEYLRSYFAQSSKNAETLRDLNNQYP